MINKTKQAPALANQRMACLFFLSADMIPITASGKLAMKLIKPIASNKQTNPFEIYAQKAEPKTLFYYKRPNMAR
ncbi:hypothetical protein [Paenibacillus sp. NEAU-GSW1]|uniref:hypothetical protein n=1 Tax=Paenibacillus sp. NEAU-GSW1 TaxID=2682486 RepID=UPI0012E311B3|nr:hypothetical protein [Paenibacillus sp. NEAU-GSW1]MUT68007.1 hypothetical protein [Paenibacillus sp. NEAU-GSW1]